MRIFRNKRLVALFVLAIFTIGFSFFNINRIYNIDNTNSSLQQELTKLNEDNGKLKEDQNKLKSDKSSIENKLNSLTQK